MQLAPYKNRDSYRVWLSPGEAAKLVSEYNDDPQKELALSMALCGLRGDEIRRATHNHIRELNTEMEAYKLTVPTGKTGHRETPIGRSTVKTATIYKNAAGVGADEPLVDVATKTIRRWVAAAASNLADSTDNDDWRHVTSHDLRRSWATNTFYSLNASSVALEVVMNWGGWKDEQVFRQNYLGKEPDDLAVDLMETAGLR